MHSCIHQAMELVGQDWLNDDSILDSLLSQVNLAEEASARVVDNISSLVTEKHGV